MSGLMKDMFSSYGILDLPAKCIMSEIMNKTMKIKKIIFAIPAAAAAIPVKPSKPATSAITKKVSTQVSIMEPQEMIE
jgi:hypothetical protein